MSHTANKDLVQKFNRIATAHDYQRLGEVVHEDVVRHSPSTPDVEVNSRADLERFLRQDAATFPDGEITLDQLIAEGSLVAFYGTFRGTQEGEMGPFPATGKKVVVESSGFFRIRDDRIAELWIVWDNVSALTQLGHLPPPG